MVAHFTMRTYGIHQEVRFVEGICKLSSNPKYLSILHHTCAICPEIPSFISTMSPQLHPDVWLLLIRWYLIKGCAPITFFLYSQFSCHFGLACIYMLDIFFLLFIHNLTISGCKSLFKQNLYYSLKTLFHILRFSPLFLWFL